MRTFPRIIKNGRVFAALTLVVTGAAAHAQELTLDRVLAGRDLPLSISAKQLTPEYLHLVAGEAPGIASLQNMMIDSKTGVETGLYFSKGQTVTAGSETYLVAYRPDFQVDVAGVLNHHGPNDGAPVQARKMRPNMVLSLSLLNLRTSARLDDIRAFDAKRDMESPQESSEASTRNLRGLGQGMMAYLSNRAGGVMPVIGASVTAGVRRTFYPFVHDQQLWVQPATDEPYRPSSRISRLNVNLVANRPFVVAFYETTPGSDGLRGVVFLDGHVERVTAERFSRLQSVKIIARPGVKSVYASGSSTTVVVQADPFGDD